MRLSLSRAGSLLVFLVFAAASPVLAATITVNSLGDTLTTNGMCTLREAVINSNDNAATWPDCAAGSGPDVINLRAGTITMTVTGRVEDASITGDYDIHDSLTINGHPSGTVINGNNVDRIFDVNSWLFIPPGTPPATPITFALNGVHIDNGDTFGDGAGFVINLNTTATADRVTVSGCTNNNDAGGVMNHGTLTMRNSTITGNHALLLNGAIRNDGDLTLIGCTITANTALPDRGAVGGYGVATNLRNTIIVGNNGAAPDLEGFFNSQGFNIIGNIALATITPTTGDQFGATLGQVNLGPLGLNGGSTPNHALLSGSIAIDKGHSSTLTTDQRNMTRPCDLAAVANAAGGDGGDIGAFEVQGPCGVAIDAINDLASVAEDSGANAIAVLANDVGSSLTITAVTQGANGSVINNGTNVSYTPNANFFGADSFTYTISDGSNTDTATVNVTVTPVNDPPVAVNDAYATANVAAPGVLANDSDIDGDSLTAILATGPSNGTVVLNPNGGFVYTPNPGACGPDSFTYRANDGTTNSNVATVTITLPDTTAPTLTASVATSTLWTPNHNLVNVGLSVSATDNCGATTQIGVFSDEDDVTGDPDDHSPDAKDIAAGTLRLRSERIGSGDGRVYLIIVTAIDASSNTTRKCLTVVVPKSQNAAHVNSVNAQATAAAAQCQATGLAPAGYFVVGDGPVIGPKQ